MDWIKCGAGIGLFLFLLGICSQAEPQSRLNLAPNPTFEDAQWALTGWYPVGLAHDLNSSLSISTELVFQGNSALKVHVCPDAVVSGTEYYSSYNAGEGTRFYQNQPGVHGVRTIAYRLDRDIQTVQASVWVLAEEGEEISLEIRWFSRFGRRRPVEGIHTDSSSQIVQRKGAWSQYGMEAIRPDNTHQVQVVVMTHGKKPFYIDEVWIDLIRRENSLILVDQLGYEIDSLCKTALFQQSSAKQTVPERFQVIGFESQKTAYEGNWRSLGYLPEFDRTYWKAEFSSLHTKGCYAIQTRIGDDLFFSDPFIIGDSVVINGAARSAAEFFYYQRCGTSVPGFHGPCHLDDAVLPDGTSRDLSGGWHDAGDYNKYNGYTPESFYALILAYDRKKEFYQTFDRDRDGIADILDEAIWGAKYLEKCLDLESFTLAGTVSTGYRYWGKPEEETDNKPGTGDERPLKDLHGSPALLPAAFALLSKHTANPKYLDIAEKLFEKHSGSIVDALALYGVTQNPQYKEFALKRASGFLGAPDRGVSNFRELAELAFRFPSEYMARQVKEIAPARLEQLKQQCDAFFGIARRGGRDGKPVYFMDYRQINDWYVGESREYLDFAYEGLLLDKLGWKEGRTLAENQLHWIFGLNPFQTSLMEGAGRRFIPQYHHRYNTLPACPNGAVPGAVVNGITRSWPWTDRPWLDLHPVPTGEYQCNEPWLPHNNRMLFVISLW